MLKALRFRWKVFRRQRPGRRFQAIYWRTKRSPHGNDIGRQVVRIAAGAAALVVGSVLLFTPIPGTPFCAAIAAVLFAPESIWLARLLDRTELKLRSVTRAGVRWWRRRRK